tara:strand:- start:3386 stop:5143 length:1758 start_codon:yes stop_codon:yes gene_type:complete
MKRSLVAVIAVSIFCNQAMAAMVTNTPHWTEADSLSGWWGDSVNDVFIDQVSGDVYVTGEYRFDLHAGDDSIQAMQHHTGNTSDIFVGKWSQGQWAWIVSAGGPDDDWGSSITMASDGMIYVAGGYKSNTTYFDDISLNNTDITPRTLSTSPTSEAYVAQLDPQSGDWMWVYGLAGQTQDWGTAVEPSPNGGIFLAGNYASNSLSGDNGSLMPGWGDGGMTDSFLIEFDSSGSMISHSSLFDPDSDLMVSDMAITTEGKVMIAGYFIGQAAYGIPNKTVSEAPGYSEGMIASWDPVTRSWEWIAMISGQNSEEVYSLDADESGGAYVLSRSSSDTTYSIGPDNSSRLSNTNTGITGTTDVLVSRISASGQWIWTEAVEGVANDDAHSIAAIEGGAILVGATSSMYLTFGEHTIQKSADPVNMDLWMAGIGNDGSWEWALGLGMAKWPESTSIDHSLGKTILGGSFSTRTAAFGDITIQNWDNQSTYQWPDGYIAALDHGPIVGCTDPLSPNFDQTATSDDGSCSSLPGDSGGNQNPEPGIGEDLGGKNEPGSSQSVFGAFFALIIICLIGFIVVIARTSDDSGDE